MRSRVAASVIGLLLGCGLATAQTKDSERAASSTGIPQSASRLANPQDVRKRLGLIPDYESVAGVDSIKIAVLDYGFDGLSADRPYLPKTTEVVEHYDPEFVRRFGLGDPEFRKGFEPANRHGRIMAQIIWGVTGLRPTGPKFFLLNANGPTMLRRAVRFAIEKKVDIILFSGSFEGGGNGDGRGSINRVVADALAANIVWINAAGNYGHHVFNAPVRILSDGYLRLREGSDVASLRFRNRVDENTINVTLTWSDYRDEEDAGTDKDLDLYVENGAGRRVGASEKVQVSGSHIPGPDETRNPRERVVLTNLPASPEVITDPDYGYRIRIKAKAGRFNSTDRVRMLVTASRDFYLPPGGNMPREAFEFTDASDSGELYPPADNPRVLTVGDSDPSSSLGPTADGRIKPDVILEDSRAFFSDGEISSGSSDAAAYIAGVVAVLKTSAPVLHSSDLFRLAKQGPAVSLSTLRGSTRRSSSATGYHYWQTPSRARLAEVIRTGR